MNKYCALETRDPDHPAVSPLAGCGSIPSTGTHLPASRRRRPYGDEITGRRDDRDRRIAAHETRRADENRANDDESVLLRDGGRVLIRPIRQTDATLLADGFARLSLQSRWFRFLTAKIELSAAELRYFTHVDHHDHEALVAVSMSDGRAVGVARYIRNPHEPLAADVAVTVADDWQRRGLATHLLTRLSDRAADAGVTSYTVLVAADNRAVFTLMSNSGLDVRSGHADFGAVEVKIALPMPVSAA
jgi:GNAT superfamily N-acetyltransferase